MLLAHISDLHFYHFPHWSGILTKRIIGLANLYVRGRIRHFDAEIARRAIDSVSADRPDAVLISGDFTALASPREFASARQALEELIERFPVAAVPGNHDYYTLRAVRGPRIEEYFGDVIRTPGARADDPVYPTLHLFGETAVLGINPNRFTWAAAGRIDPREMERLSHLLQRPEVAARFPILLTHYPLINENGTATRKIWRRLENRELLLAIMRRFRIPLLIHGHDHRRYNNFLSYGDGPDSVALLANAGSAGYSRGLYPASYNLYRIEDKKLVEVIFKDYRDGRFQVSFQGPPAKIPGPIFKV